MTLSIQFATHQQLVAFANKPYDSDQLPHACNAQSDKAAEYAERFLTRFDSLEAIIQAKKRNGIELDSYDNVTKMDDLIKALGILGVLSIKDSKRALDVAMKTTHKQYMHLRAEAESQRVTMIEWMFAVLYYVKFYESQREKFFEYDALRNNQFKLEREVLRVGTRLDKHREKIASIQHGIDLQMEHMKKYQALELEEIARLEKLDELLKESEKKTRIGIKEQTKAQLEAENRFGDILKEVTFF